MCNLPPLLERRTTHTILARFRVVSKSGPPKAVLSLFTSAPAVDFTNQLLCHNVRQPSVTSIFQLLPLTSICTVSQVTCDYDTSSMFASCMELLDTVAWSIDKEHRDVDNTTFMKYLFSRLNRDLHTKQFQLRRTGIASVNNSAHLHRMLTCPHTICRFIHR